MWLFFRLAHEGEVRQQLLEQGLDPRQVRRAVRYGRADELRQTVSNRSFAAFAGTRVG